MKFHKIKSFAKVNLTLKILNKYSNGYHKIESLISKINLADEILIKEIQGSKNRISFSGKFSSNISNTNTISKLLKILNNHNYIKNKKFNIKVKKNIPQSSGMGGGSMNAASILNYLFKKRIIKITKNNLIKIANKVGSDVILGLYESPMMLQGKILVNKTNLIKFSFDIISRFLVTYSIIKSRSPFLINHSAFKSKNFFLSKLSFGGKVLVRRIFL